MAKTYSCTGEKCPILDGGVKKCTAKNCEDRTPYNADEFFGRRKQTNADRLRAMSDEELAYFLNEIEAEAIKRSGRFLTAKQIVDGQAQRLDWLKQEVGDARTD